MVLGGSSILLALGTCLASAIPNPVNFNNANSARGLTQRATYTGKGTVYNQLGTYGSCGHMFPDTAYIAALSESYWMGDKSPAPACGWTIVVINQGSNDGVGGAGNWIEVTIEDTCRGCGDQDVDLSLAAWNFLTDNAPWANINIKWQAFHIFV